MWAGLGAFAGGRARPPVGVEMPAGMASRFAMLGRLEPMFRASDHDRLAERRTGVAAELLIFLAE